MTGGIFVFRFINELHTYKTRVISVQYNLFVIYHRDV